MSSTLERRGFLKLMALPAIGIAVPFEAKIEIAQPKDIKKLWDKVGKQLVSEGAITMCEEIDKLKRKVAQLEAMV